MINLGTQKVEITKKDRGFTVEAIYLSENSILGEKVGEKSSLFAVSTLEEALEIVEEQLKKETEITAISYV